MSSPPARKRGVVKKLAIVAVVLVVLIACLEGAFRWVIFSESDFARRWGYSIRRASMYADRWNEDDYWYLDQLFRGEPGLLPRPSFDPWLGWRSHELKPNGYDHFARETLDGRRPILMYGDSFAMCMTESEQCWEGLMEQSDLGKQYKLVNYGMRGYGIDQINILMRKSLPLWKDLNPIVIVGIYLEDDLDRAWLKFRGWPKPYFRLQDNQLKLQTGKLEYFDENALAAYETDISSYLGRFVMFHPAFPSKLRDRLLGKQNLKTDIQNLSIAILDSMSGYLKQQELQYFFVLFHGEKEVGELKPKTWHEPACIDSFTRLGSDWVSSRRVIQRDWLDTGRSLDDYFGHQGYLIGHYSPLGQRVVFRAITDGLAGKFEREYMRCGCQPDGFYALPDQAQSQFLFASSAPCQRFGFDHAVGVKLAAGTVKLVWVLDGRCATFHAKLVLPEAPRAEGAPPSEPRTVKVTVKNGNNVLQEMTVVGGAEPVPLEVRVGRGPRFEVMVQVPDGTKDDGRLLLGDVEFR
ncbi:MAG: hypothetical protein L6Q99_05050 [Planctomycetes bacterium]|nr:hypothetical protein [Planctomycetota bacterium]